MRLHDMAKAGFGGAAEKRVIARVVFDGKKGVFEEKNRQKEESAQPKKRRSSFFVHFGENS